jgi:hypothetical protein
MILIFVFVLSILVLQLLKARIEDSKGEGNLISKQARKNVNEKGRLEQAIEREPHAKLILISEEQKGMLHLNGSETC